MSKYLKCETDKNPLSYKCGEKIVFKISAMDNTNKIACQYIKWQIAGDDGQNSSGLGSCTATEPLVLETTLKTPGFIRLTATVHNGDKSQIADFDLLEAGAGADVDKIAYCDTLPDDFNEYWDEIEKEVAEFPLKVIEKREIKDALQGFKAYDVKIAVPSGKNASGIVTVPDKQGVFPIVVSFRGYGVSPAIALYKKDTIRAEFNAHGIENNKAPLEVEFNNKELLNYGFSDSENADKTKTYWRNMMIRNLMAVKYLKSLECWDKKELTAAGGSQGALQATTVAAHDKDVTFLDIAIPWFCNLKSIEQGFMRGWRPNCAEGLRYFDTVAQATRVKCPVKIVAGLGDYICPPSTVMTLYNTFKGIKSIDFIQAKTHSYNPPEKVISTLSFDPQNPTGEIKKGVYRHFKGNEYKVLDFGFHSETNEEYVIYKALYGDGDIWLRPKSMFNEYVMVDGKPVKRFEFLGE